MHPDFPFHFPFFSYCFFSPSIFFFFHYFSILCRFFFLVLFPPPISPPRFSIILFVWASFYTYEHAVVEHLSLAKYSTAQPNQPCTTQHSKHVPIRARQRKQAGTAGERQHVVKAFTTRCVLKTNENRNLPGPTKICSSQSQNSLWRCDCAKDLFRLYF